MTKTKNPDEDGICWKTKEYEDEDASNDRLGYWYYSKTAYIKVTTVSTEQGE